MSFEIFNEGLQDIDFILEELQALLIGLLRPGYLVFELLYAFAESGMLRIGLLNTLEALRPLVVALE